LPKLSEKLKQARKQKEVTQGQLSQKIGADIQRISKYERGILIPTTEIMIKLSNALDVSLDYLLKNDKNRVTGKVKDAELIDQFVQVDALPDQDRHMLKALLDAFIKKYQFEALAMK
jgi:transcriptional regulator with XRE-family HTH domain